MTKSICYACEGPVEVVTGEGRVRMYRGVLCTLPADLPIRTCMKCGAQWMNSAEIKVLSDILEAQRIAGTV